MEFYSARKRNETLPFATTWMSLEGVMVNEISQTEKNKCHMISLYVESKKQNKQSKRNKLRFREQTDGCQMGWWWW